ncbi:MAG: hypothetical protein DRI40_03060 [Chloroflexi bacterium]|nr:MAG: hypothetical protein DRI40_03060 [Chloroflexota bacterium]
MSVPSFSVEGKVTIVTGATAGLGPDFVDQYSRTIPLQRAAQPDDHLGPAIFLALDASAYITGAIVPSDGGPQ